MGRADSALNVSYLHYGSQSGVTPHVTRALREVGHNVDPLHVPGPLEPRDEQGRRRLSLQFAAHIAVSLLKYGRQWKQHRWNTTYAFDVHSSRADDLLRSSPRTPDVVLQNGALFSPGPLPERPYVLLLDHTRELSMQRTPDPEAGLPAALDYGPGWRLREMRAYQSAAAIATFSQRVAESLIVDYSVAPTKIQVVGAGANVYPEYVTRRDDGKTLLFVGKDFRRKGGVVLLRAFERLRRERPELKLLIAGPKEHLELPPGATNLGLVPPDQLPELFAQSTLFVLPTLREPFGLAFLDAMACGLPCIGTDVEAVPEIIENGPTGLLVPTGNHVALADTIASLLDDPARAHAMGLRGRLKVDNGFLWKHVGQRLDATLRSAAGRGATRDNRAAVA
jgi:glycosyltransferase involved in cell wall biosynthesis